MKQAKQYKRTYIPFPIIGKREAISVSCDEKGRYRVYRDGKRVNPDSVVGMKICKMFFGMNILERGKQGYAGGLVNPEWYE